MIVIPIIAAFLMLFLVMLWALENMHTAVDDYWEKEIIKRGYAKYTGEDNKFTWNDEI
jgi:hypothetical protein